jgi:hypothetical protein
VVVFVCANRLEDAVCADATQFAEMSEAHDLELWAACEGQGERPIARNATSLMKLLIDCVWDTPPTFGGTVGTSDASGDGSTRSVSLTVPLERLCASVTSSHGGSQLSKVIIFTSHARLRSLAGSEGILALGRQLEGQGARPVLVLCSASDERAAHSLPSAGGGTNSQGMTRMESGHSIYQQFVNACAQSGWEIITEHSG